MDGIGITVLDFSHVVAGRKPNCPIKVIWTLIQQRSGKKLTISGYDGDRPHSSCLSGDSVIDREDSQLAQRVVDFAVGECPRP